MALSAIGGGFGSSLFQQSNREIHQLGGQATQAKMNEVKAVTGDSKFGSSTKAGTSEFQQTQRTVVRTGEQSASRATQQAAQNMDPAMLGTSAFQKSNRSAQQMGAQATQAKMDEVKAVTSDSKFGSSTKAGTSEFQQTQRTVIRTAEQVASRATQQAAQNMDPAMLGTSRFQKSLREAQQYGAQATSQRMEQAKAAYAISPRAPQHVGSNLDIKA